MPSLRRVESIAHPKELLDDIIQAANKFRGRPITREKLYGPLGETVRLEKLASLSAYQQFTSDLTNALTNLGIISRNSE
jgi:hypothetical protein